MLLTMAAIVQGIPDGPAIIASMHVLASPSTMMTRNWFSKASSRDSVFYKTLEKANATEINGESIIELLYLKATTKSS